MCVSSGIRVCVLGRAVHAPIHGLRLLLSVIPPVSTQGLQVCYKGERQKRVGRFSCTGNDINEFHFHSMARMKAPGSNLMMKI